LSPGVNFSGNQIYQRPFDNGAIADWTVNGGLDRKNEFLLDGAPNNAQAGGNNIALVPPVDSVQEFSITTSVITSNNGGRTPIANLINNPFPDGLLKPPG